MHKLRKHLIGLVVANVATLASGFLSAADKPDDVTIARDESVLSVLAGKQPVLRYRHGKEPFKPYVKELFTPGGVQILRDAPHDHLHHHGVMFAVFANGVDFWSEKKDCGKQIGVELKADKPERTGGVRQCRFTHRLQWTPPQPDRPLLLEQRTIEVHRGVKPDVTLLTWHTQLQPAEGVGTVKLTGTHYDGLGIRFVQSMDQTGHFQQAAAEQGPIVRGTDRVTPAKWAAYTARADGKPVTVAVFDHPDNARHPAGMFTMLRPFSYLSATPNIWKKPMELKQDDVLKLRYGVAVWDGEIGPEQIEALYQHWTRFKSSQSR